MPASSLSFDVGALESSIGFTLPCKLQVADGARYFASSFADTDAKAEACSKWRSADGCFAT